MAKIRVGVVGAGVMGGFHIKIASSLPDAKLIGIFDLDQSRAQEIADKYHTIALPSLDALMNGAEAIIVASPTSTHLEVCKIAINRKKHLLVEKPLTMDSSSSAEIVSLASAKKLVLAVGMIERFNPAFTKAFSLTKHEKILGIDIRRFSPFPERISDASVVWDVMIHDLDLAFLLGKVEIDSLKAFGRKVKTSVLDEAEATLYFKDGTIARVSASRVKEGKIRDIQITTERCIYEADLLNKKLYRRSFETLVDKEEIETKSTDQLTLEQKDFYSAINKGRAPCCPGDQALKVIRLAEEVEAKCSCQ